MIRMLKDQASCAGDEDGAFTWSSDTKQPLFWQAFVCERALQSRHCVLPPASAREARPLLHADNANRIFLVMPLNR